MTVVLASPMLLILMQAQFGPQQKMLLGGAAICFFFLILTIRSTFSAPVNRSSLNRLQHYIDREENLSPLERVLDREEEEFSRETRQRKRRSNDLLPTLTKVINNSRVDFLNKLSADLNRIGSSWRASEIVYVAVLFAILGFFVVGILLQKVIPGLAVALICFYLPFAVVRFYARRWMIRFETQLADTLLLMANAVQAGYGFQQAMEMVAREGQPPMADEFAKMSQEVQLGIPISEALSHMAERVQNTDFTLAVTAIQISMEVGGALADILRSISETIRERVRIRGEISILTAQGKITGLLLSLLPLGMFFLLNLVGSDPDTKEKYSEPLFDGENYPMGPKMVAYGIISQLFGYWVISRIVNIEV